MKIKRFAAALLAAIVCLSLCACGEKEPQSKDSLSIWYVGGTAAADQLLALTGEYASENGQTVIAMRAFENEESLAAAFETALPDLLLCSHARAIDLYERGLLRDIAPALGESAPEYLDYLSRRFEGVGHSFFPIGMEVQLLYAGDGCFNGAAPETMRELMSLASEYGREKGLPFITADSFADLLYDAMLSQGAQLHGIRERDIFNEDYISAYNLFAKAAYDGGLVCMDYPAWELVDSGYLPCAAARSSSLAGLSADSFITVLPAAGDGSRLASCVGIAVTAKGERTPERVVRFMSWLLEKDRLCALAFDSALVPAVKNAQPLGDSSLTSALMELYSGGELHLPDYSGDYMNNRAQIEAELRSAYGLLS